MFRLYELNFDVAGKQGGGRAGDLGRGVNILQSGDAEHLGGSAAG